MAKAKLARTTISGQPSELAQIQEWADEHSMTMSQFIKISAATFIKSGTENDASYQEAEHVVKFSNRLTDIEHSLNQLEIRLFGNEDSEPEHTGLGIEQQVLDGFRALFNESKRLLTAQEEQLQRAININHNLEQRLSAYQHQSSEDISHQPFAERLMRKMKL